ncbi:lysosomal proton-coupled steroid conjugate and bile acid symporter SLC46A3-like [Babylonia areolata]|uniref:lysosomal proton-coupled steroid conjugate and bile acid symporter SLC46A3-like n=1 Tax=Babylonia areolata TaxID=304850 RepID=UPI003FD10D27
MVKQDRNMATQVNERSPMRRSGSQNETESQTNWKWKMLTRIYKLIDRIQSYFVEVALFFFFLARHMTLPLFQEYVQTEIYSQHGLDFLSLTHNANASRGAQWNDAHHESVLVVLGLQIAEGLPAIVTVIILGALSDRTGRHRIMLWLPALGSCLYSFIYILIQYTGWSVDGLFLASALRGLSGSMTAFLAGASFYAINSVKPHQRTSRLAIQEFLNGGAYAVGNLMVGFWVKDTGFLRPFWFALICSIIALLISFFLIDETMEAVNEEQQRQQQSPRRNRNTGNCCKDLFQPMAKYFKCWQSSTLVKIWLAILAFQTYAFVHIGQENTLVLYLTGQPYLYFWRNSITGAAPWVKIGLLLSVIMAVAAIATALCTPIFQRFMSDTLIVFIGLASKAVGTLWIAIVHNETLIFFSILFLAFELLPFPMLRSSVSRGIAPSQQGSLFAMMHCGESITYFLAPFAFSAIYASTLHYYSGLVFIVSFLLLTLPVGFTLGLWYMERNSPVEYEPMGNGNDGAEVNQTSTTDPTESAMLPRDVPAEPISFIALDQNPPDAAAV